MRQSSYALMEIATPRTRRLERKHGRGCERECVGLERHAMMPTYSAWGAPCRAPPLSSARGTYMHVALTKTQRAAHDLVDAPDFQRRALEAHLSLSLTLNTGLTSSLITAPITTTTTITLIPTSACSFSLAR
mmetsp:Transcript_34834/g.74334  ORF Transcript_34834/g.74334 Transcript_34834/m.74334 type:complete len:132 (-) Transcript_34834:546-941(-)